MKLSRQCLWLSIGLSGGMALVWTASRQRRSRLDERIHQLELAVTAKESTSVKSDSAHLARGKRTVAEIVARMLDEAGRNMVAQLRLEEFSEALELAKQEPDPRRRQSKCYGLLVRWAELDGRSALNEMNRLEGIWVRGNIGTILRIWAKHNPSGLLDWLGKSDHEQFVADPKNKGESYCTTPMAVCDVAQYHPELALDYVLNRTSLMDHPLTLTRVVEQAAENPRLRQRLLDMLPKLTEAKRRKAVLGIFRAWVLSDPAAAAQWFTTLPSEERQSDIQEVASVLGSADHNVAVEWVRSLTGEEQSKAISPVVTAWVHNDPRAGMDYAFQHMADQPEECGRCFAEWVTGHTQTDAVAWLNQQPSSPAKDWAIAKYSEMLQKAAAEHLSMGPAYDDPVAAAEYNKAAALWRAQIQDEAIRVDVEAKAQKTLKMLEQIAASESREP